MYSESELTQLRIDRFVRERLQPATIAAVAAVEIEAWEVPDEPVPFSQAVAAGYSPFAIGQTWGRPWGTTWFRVSGTVPRDWRVDAGDVELEVDLGFTASQVGFQAEALAWAPDGRILKAIEPFNGYVRLQVGPGESFEVFLEAASNPDLGSKWVDFAPTSLGRKETAPGQPLYALRRIDLVHRDSEVWELVQDVAVVRGLAAELPEASPRRAALFVALDAMADAVDPFDVRGTASDGRTALSAVLASPAAPSAHRVFAVGHAHIDSAWLWPVRETIRKCARTFSNVLDLMDQDPDFVFACSSAQQFFWMKQFYPELFERIRARVSEGRFIPVGGMWVESDTNMPSGESLVRQFVEGKRFFMEEFGYEPREVWLPDSFGYTGAFPQIARAAGTDHFLTQKISWNEVNRFPHHSFEWEGIDGSRIFTHFPPVDSYNARLSAAELAHAERNLRDKSRTNTSLVPFGFGDGGGGPTREMLAAAHRTRSLEGSPTVRLASPAEFFSVVTNEPNPAPVWAGELYLEFHRGTYTSQARTKRGNRRSEQLLHEAELWATTASVRVGAVYPTEVLRAAWRTVLLQQFHDILPGSSIGWVHDQAEANYARVAKLLEGVIAEALSALGVALTTADRSLSEPDSSADLLVNASPFPVDGIAAYGAGPRSVASGVSLEKSDNGLVIANGLMRVAIDREGLIISIVDLATDREVVPTGERAGVLQLFRDTPTQWDAWDVDVEYRRSGVDLTKLDSIDVVTNSPERVTIRTVRTFGRSMVTQTIEVEAGRRVVDFVTHVDWHERQHLLKFTFPIDVHTTTARSEIQFGHIERPTHTNTSWDTARFETPAHRWVHVSDVDFGVGIANDATYGHDITRHPRDGGGTYSLVRQTLLRAPLFPDPDADQGDHQLRSSIVIGGVGDAIETGYRLNVPLRAGTSSPGGHQLHAPLLASSDPSVVIETVKLAEDGSGDVIVRLYESYGGRVRVRISADFGFTNVRATDLLERDVPSDSLIGTDAGGVSAVLRPFQFLTLRFERDPAHSTTR